MDRDIGLGLEICMVGLGYRTRARDTGLGLEICMVGLGYRTRARV